MKNFNGFTRILAGSAAVLLGVTVLIGAATLAAAQDKPNILILLG
jgi:hypothetical protein